MMFSGGIATAITLLISQKENLIMQLRWGAIA